MVGNAVGFPGVFEPEHRGTLDTAFAVDAKFATEFASYTFIGLGFFVFYCVVERSTNFTIVD